MPNSGSNQFLERYKAISDEEAYYFIPNGLLEIGNVLGSQAAQGVLQGCLPPLRVTNLDEDFADAISSMERGALHQAQIPTLEQATEPSTCALTISYRHCLYGTEEQPRQRMVESQKHALLAAVKSIATEHNATHALLWIDQAMGQRYPRSERDWIRHGILPYFAFDVLILREHHSPDRCWLHLEELIARSYAETVAMTNDAHLFRKMYDYGTIPSIQGVAAEVLSGPLRDKDAYDPDDKEQIMRWAAGLLRQRQPMANLVMGSSWSSRVYDIKGLLTVIRNHQLDSSSEAVWRDLSRLNASKRWHGLSELIGVPDVEAIAATPEEVREALVNLGPRYMFNVFATTGSTDTSIKAVAIGCFKCFARPTRIILCLLDNTVNEEGTHVLSSCILDADKEAGSDEDEAVKIFLRAFQQLYITSPQVRDNSSSELNTNDRGFEEQEHVAVETSAELVADILGWPRLATALERRGVHSFEGFLESMQAGRVRWG